MAETFGHPGAQVVVDEAACDAFDGLFACRIDVEEDHVVEQRETVGEFVIEVAGAGVEVRLEDACQPPPVEHLTQGEDALADFFRMMGVVAQQDVAAVFDFEVEAPVYAAVCLHAAAYLVGVGTGDLCECHGGDAVVDVDAHGDAQLNAVDAAERRDEVERDAPVTDVQVFGVEVALVAAVVVTADAGLRLGVQFETPVADQDAVGTDERRIVAEALQISLLGAVDVEVVGVRGRDDGGIGRQVVERAVELVGLNDDIGARVVDEVVRAVVLRDAAEEGVATHVALVQDVGRHGRGGRLAVRAGHAESFHRTGECSEHLGAFLYLKAVCAEPRQFFVVGGYGRRVDNKCVRTVTAGFGDGIGVVVVMDEGSLFAELLGEGAGCAVVAAHGDAFREEIAFEGAHADAAGSDEIY